MRSPPHIKMTLLSIGVLMFVALSPRTNADIADNLIPGDRVKTEKGCGVFIEENLLGATVLLDSGQKVVVGECQRTFSSLQRAKTFVNKFASQHFRDPKRELRRLTEIRQQNPEKARAQLVQDYGLRSADEVQAALELLTEVARLESGTSHEKYQTEKFAENRVNTRQ